MISMRDKILNYIVEHGSIDLDECWEAFHTQKLATRISELIDRGVPIEKNWVYKKLPNGKVKKMHKVYTIRREAVNEREKDKAGGHVPAGDGPGLSIQERQ